MLLTNTAMHSFFYFERRTRSWVTWWFVLTLWHSSGLESTGRMWLMFTSVRHTREGWNCQSHSQAKVSGSFSKMWTSSRGGGKNVTRHKLELLWRRYIYMPVTQFRKTVAFINKHLLSLLLTISCSLLSEMEASVVVSVSPQQQWSGSTGDPGYGRYSFLLLSLFVPVCWKNSSSIDFAHEVHLTHHGWHYSPCKNWNNVLQELSKGPNV